MSKQVRIIPCHKKPVSDMKNVLAVVRKYLDMEAELTVYDNGSEYMEHPFLSTRDFRLIADASGTEPKASEVLGNPELLQRLKDSKWAWLSKLPVAKIIKGANSGYSFRLLRDIEEFLSPDDLAATLRANWPSEIGTEPSGCGECTKEDVVRWFRACNPRKLMSPMDFKMFSALPDVITVYRCEPGMEGMSPTDTTSWTTDPETAMEQPEGDSRFGGFYYEGGYRASIAAEDVLAYYFRHNMEVVLDPDQLFDIEPVQAMGEVMTDSAMYEEMAWQKDLYNELYETEVRRLLVDKLTPLGRANELIEAMADSKKYDSLVSEFDLWCELRL